MSNFTLASVSPEVRKAFAPIIEAVARARIGLASSADVVAVRPGYKYSEGSKPQPAVVVAVTPGSRPVIDSELEKT